MERSGDVGFGRTPRADEIGRRRAVRSSARRFESRPTCHERILEASERRESDMLCWWRKRTQGDTLGEWSGSFGP